MINLENNFTTKLLQEYQNYIHDEYHQYNFKSDRKEEKNKWKI
jgi:hypothetical protein